jgi:membrane protein implicated in regulation of membrane protease activity
MVIAWLVFGVVLMLVELHNVAFYALFAAIGAFAAALVAAVAPGAIAVQAGVAVAVTVAGVGAVRPYVSQAMLSHRGVHNVRGVHGGIVGHEARTLDEVGDAYRGGHVRLVGERWLAISASGVLIPPDTTVIVTAVQGTTLVVVPVDALGPAPADKEGEHDELD